jgi:hypothetical protein
MEVTAVAQKEDMGNYKSCNESKVVGIRGLIRSIAMRVTLTLPIVVLSPTELTNTGCSFKQV